MTHLLFLKRPPLQRELTRTQEDLDATITSRMHEPDLPSGEIALAIHLFVYRQDPVHRRGYWASPDTPRFGQAMACESNIRLRKQQMRRGLLICIAC